ncbi:MAG TPA: hypothetical protein VGO07_01355 [Candidatus Saccharimonadales bacterium]|jgi:hypothetical protein|nr:hypothetical protein [Candidatus Saccharimonadales bacterium]
MQFMKRQLDRQAIKIAAARLSAIMGVAILLASGALPTIQVYAAATATIIAGMPSDGPLVNDIPATSAQFWNPSDVATTSDGTIYIADMSHQEIRSIGADGIIHAAFGDGIQDCSTGGIQTRLWNPQSIVVDEHDNMYVSTACGQIVEFTPGNPIGTVVAGKYDGTGNPHPFTGDGMVATDVTMQPSVMAYDRVSGALYFNDGRSQRILKLTDGLLTTAVGNGTPGFSGDGGPATTAQFAAVGGMTFADGNLYLSDGGNCRVRMVTADGNISTIAGDGACHDANTTGPALAASIEYPARLAMDNNGILYVAGSISGSIFAYDTQTKNLAPVIQIISSTSGMAMDKDGNLLALHSGVNQQLYRITGLPTPTPPPDGKQHGRVTNVSWGVSNTTALWNMDVTVNTSGVTCPAVVVVTVGTWQKRASVCAMGQPAPAATHFKWKVFNDTHSLQPGSTPAVAAFVAKSDAPHYGGGATTLAVPGVPTIVGVGDSYVSGHNQTLEDTFCERPADTSYDSTLCNLHTTDYNFSWVTRMANKLDANTPIEWLFDYDPSHLLARSGATTRQMFEQGQIEGMTTLLGQHQGTWNVVAFDGGANNIDFAGALSDFYHNHNVTLPAAQLAPWDVKRLHWSDCPNTDILYHNLFGYDSDPTAPPITPVPLPVAQEPIIAADLKQLLDTGRAASSSTRFVDMFYPYTLKDTNICSETQANPNDPLQTWHGATSVVDGLAHIHNGLAASDVKKLDLRDTFGADPRPKLQLIRNYGYPHPNDAGQLKIAQQAAKLLLKP